VGAAGSAGGMAFALQRMGLAPAGVDKLLWGTAIGGAAGVGIQKADWLLLQALKNERYRDLLTHAVENNKINPLFYNAMLGALTPEERKDYDRQVKDDTALAGRKKGR
jgi:hypothetical protein